MSIGTCEARPAVLAASLQNIYHFSYLLILEQPPYQLRAWILPNVFSLATGQQHLRLDAQESRGHLEVIGGFIQFQRRDPRQKLLGDSRDWDVVDVYLLVTDQCQEQIKWARVFSKFNDEDFGRRGVADPQ